MQNKIEFPTNCPECNTELIRESVDLVCTNEKCPAKVEGLFKNFFNVLEIKGVSEKFIEKAIEKYKIKSIKDMLELSEEDLKNLPGFAEKSAKQAYEKIHSVKKIPPYKFMALLNIPNQGRRVFENILSNISFEYLISDKCSPEDLICIEGIAEKSANDIHQGIKSKLDIIKENKEIFEIEEISFEDNPLISDKIFCITGSLETGNRKQFEDEIKKFGGKVGSVSKKLDFLVTNDPAGSSSKIKKADKLIEDGCKIKIINEKDLISMLKGDEINE